MCVRRIYGSEFRKYGELNGFAEEMLSGSRTIGAYGRQKEMSGRFNKINGEAMDAFYKAEYKGALLFPTINLINNLSLAFVAVFGGILYMYSQNGTVLAASAFYITLGGVAQFVQYSRKFAGPINEFSNILHEFQSAFSAADRVFGVLDEAPEPVDRADAVALPGALGDVSLSHVSFGYSADKTCFIIAHRLSTIQNADTILVVRDGAIIEQGDHDTLIGQGGFYHSLYRSQFK